MKSILSIFIFAMLSWHAEAQTASDVRQVNQRVRVHQGVKTGEITRREQRRLNSQQRHIRRVERRAKADGNYTRQERRMVNRKQNRASRNIRRAKNNEIEQN